MDLWARLEAVRAPHATPTRPPGGFTAPEYAKRFGVSAYNARRELAKLVQCGKVKAIGTKPVYYTFNE